MKFTAICVALIFSLAGHCQGQQIRGMVKSEANDPLGYANVYWKKGQFGTLTNLSGLFSVKRSTIQNDTLVAELLGYEPAKYPKHVLSDSVVITLTPKAFELKEVVVAPRPAEYYVKQAVSLVPENYDTDGYQQKSYYREVIKENKRFHKYAQAILLSSMPKLAAEKDSVAVGMLHGKKSDETVSVSFMKGKAEKLRKKEIRKRKRKGEEVPEDLKKSEGFNLNLGGPHYILENNLILKGKGFLDSTKFDGYDYQLDEITRLKGRETMVISFTAEGRKAMYNGKIYIDDQTKAIAALDFELSEQGKKRIVPGYADAIMWFYGLSYHNPSLRLQIFSAKQDSTWYFDYFRFQGHVKLEKSHWFSENEKSLFEFEQLMLTLENSETVQTGKIKTNLLKPESIHDQIDPAETDNVFWNNFDLMVPEVP